MINSSPPSGTCSARDASENVAVSASRYSDSGDPGRVRDPARSLSRTQSFDWWPAHDGPPQPELFREAIASLPPGNIVIAAVPDQLHFDVVMTALDHNQHVCCVKPLVLRYSQAQEIERGLRSRPASSGSSITSASTTAA